MRPTRRAYAVLAVIAASLAAGALFGARALDAVVLPAAVALLGAVVQVWRAPTPTVERTLPPAETPGATGTVELSLRAPRSYPATVEDRLPPGIDGPEAAASDSDGGASGAGDAAGADSGRDGNGASAAVVDATIGGDAASYEITPRRRGEHEIGPATVVVTDVLGLLRRSVDVDVRDALLVFPPVRPLSRSARADLRGAYESRSRRLNRRDEFDSLREYVRGDARRDIHWKSSAKRGELVVREFAAERESERVTVAAGVESAGDARSVDAGDAEATGAGETDDEAAGAAADARTADAMAEAAASVCLSLARDGHPVALETPGGSVEVARGATRPLLEHLATVEGGPVPAVDADVEVRASNGSASVRFEGRDRSFEGMTVDAGESASTEKVAAAGRRREPAEATR